jgi:RNA polymerase-binding transcription factor DksA
VDPAAALLAAYPDCFDPRSAQEWVEARRSLLLARTAPTSRAESVSSGCAATGAHTHAQGLAVDAAHALARLDAGLGPSCEVCGATLPFERLDGAPSAVRCTCCAGRSTADTRWCR